MKLVIIESPYAPQTPLPTVKCNGKECCEEHCGVLLRRDWELKRNARYLDACLLDSLRRGEACFASHGLYTRPGVLDDMQPEERALGIRAGFAWREVAFGSIFYVDIGWSNGMRDGEADAQRVRRELNKDHVIETRLLGGDWSVK